jgi:N-sulfoglucosamine sulfohydrolase
LILELGRKNRADKFWTLNFGMRPAEELYELSRDPDCVNNLAASQEHHQRRTALERQMIEKLKVQGDPRMSGRGDVFDTYPIATQDSRGFYERFMRGEKPKAGWVRETDFEKGPVK